jgi:hypothetical protein
MEAPVWSAEAVLVCALALLGRRAESFPPIHFVEVAPSDVSTQAEAFVRVNDTHIYIITTSAHFQRLQRSRERCGDLEAARKLASVLVHEEVHARSESDEASAYAAQLTTLSALGAGVGTPLYSDVSRSMRRALARPRADLARVVIIR